MLRIRFIFILSFFMFLSCGHWTVSTLSSSKLHTIPLGDKPGQVTINAVTGGLKGISFTLHISDGEIYLADNHLKRVQVMDKDGDLNMIIGSKKKRTAKGEDFRYSLFKFSIIGKIVADSDGKIFIQNGFVSSQAIASRQGSGELDLSPSYILVFDKKGGLEYTLGQTGPPNIPFYYIESMNIDNEERLFVVSRTMTSWAVSRFKEKKRDYYFNLGKIDFKVTEGKETYTGRIERVVPYKSGEGFLISVAYYHKWRFKYRNIYEFSLKKGAVTKTIINTPDPKNELFTIVDDKHIYLWDTKEKDVKFIISTTEGNIINNVLLELPRVGVLFSNIFVDDSGNLYSFSVKKKGISIFEWK